MRADPSVLGSRPPACAIYVTMFWIKSMTLVAGTCPGSRHQTPEFYSQAWTKDGEQVKQPEDSRNPWN